MGVPGELKGYSKIYELYGGGVSWESLFEPTIRLCKKGMKVSERLAINLKNHVDIIRNDPLLRYGEISYFIRFFSAFFNYSQLIK